MKNFEVDWAQFLELLPEYRPLPVGARKALANLIETLGILPERLGEYAEPILAGGFVERVPGAKHKIRFSTERRPFRRMLRALSRIYLFENSWDRKSRMMALEEYLEYFFTAEERKWFRGHDYYGGPDALASQIMSASWPGYFVEMAAYSQCKEFENLYGEREHLGGYSYGLFRRPRTKSARTYLFYDEAVFRAAQRVVRELLHRAEPLPIADLRTALPDLTETQAVAALSAGMRYCLLFPTIRPDDFEPVVGVWPDITARLRRAPARLPEPVAPEESFAVPFLIEDMTVLLAECATTPIRLRQADGEIFAKAQEDLTARFLPVPEWARNPFQAPYTHVRIHSAYLALLSCGFAEDKELQRGAKRQMEPSRRGMEWLGLSAKERLRRVIDDLHRKDLSPRSYDWHDSYALVPHSMVVGSGKQQRNFGHDILAAFASIKADGFLPLEEFVRYQAEERNPLLEFQRELRKSRTGAESAYYRYVVRLNAPAEELEGTWTDHLHSFFWDRLVPLGAVKIGRVSDRFCFAPTDVGRYLLTRTGDFEYGTAVEEGKIIIQPNLEIVFLAPSPILEATMSRLAERMGRGVGTLFRITKKSIYAAAGAGMKADEALAVLEKASSKELPANVTREVRGWFGQCRRISLRSATLIRCPDAETALRVRSAGGGRIKPVTDTILELEGEDGKKVLIRKLRDAGIFVT